MPGKQPGGVWLREIQWSMGTRDTLSVIRAFFFLSGKRYTSSWPSNFYIFTLKQRTFIPEIYFLVLFYNIGNWKTFKFMSLNKISQLESNWKTAGILIPVPLAGPALKLVNCLNDPKNTMSFFRGFCLLGASFFIRSLLNCKRSRVYLNKPSQR